MSTDYVYIGETPCNEPCQQVGTDHYDAIMAKAECRAFINQLRRQLGTEPDGAQFKIKSEPHDAGNYLSVVCQFNPNIEEAAEYAYRAEEECPENWDKEALQELHWAVIKR